MFRVWPVSAILAASQVPGESARVGFKGAHFEAGITLVCIRWSLAYPLSYRHLAPIMESLAEK